MSDMRQPGRIDWSKFITTVISVVGVVAIPFMFLWGTMWLFPPSDQSVDPDRTEIIMHSIRMENDLIELERRVERLEIQAATGEAK